jgi:hypothetical protein
MANTFSSRRVLGILFTAAAAILALGAAPARSEPPSEAVSAAAAAFARLERESVARLANALDALVADPALVEAYRTRDRERLLALARPRFEALRGAHPITHWYFLDAEPARTVFLRVHAPPLHGDVVERDTLSQAIASKRFGHGKELGKTAFALRVVKPIRVGDEVVGYMELAEEIDHFLERMKRDTGDDFGLLVAKDRLDRALLARVRRDDRWDERKDVVLVVSTMWDERRIELGVPLAQLPARGAAVPGWSDGRRTFVGGAFPVRDASDRLAGALFVRHEVPAP